MSFCTNSNLNASKARSLPSILLHWAPNFPKWFSSGRRGHRRELSIFTEQSLYYKIVLTKWRTGGGGGGRRGGEKKTGRSIFPHKMGTNTPTCRRNHGLGQICLAPSFAKLLRVTLTPGGSGTLPPGPRTRGKEGGHSGGGGGGPGGRL